MPWLKRVDVPLVFLKSFFLFGLVLLLGNCFAQQTSVLATGQLYKLAVIRTGVHKIDSDFLRKMGVSIENVHPDKIRIFGDGGKMLPQKNAETPVARLRENAIWVKGSEDGRFDTGDAIFFYGESAHVIEADTLSSTLNHRINHYSDSTFYFLSFGEAAGLRIQPEAVASSNGGIVISEFSDYWYHERELFNILKSGRTWWGEYLENSRPFTISVDLPGVVPGSEMKFSGSALGAAPISTRFLWQVNGQLVGETDVRAVGSGTYDVKGQESRVKYSVVAPPSATSVTMSLTYDRKGYSGANGYLNYLGLQVKRVLKSYDNQQVYRFFPSSEDHVTYQFQNSHADWMLWNIDDITKPSVITLSNGSVVLPKGKRMRTMIGFQASQAYIPDSWQTLRNQDIEKLDAPELLIVTAPSWRDQAEQLAHFRRDHDGLDVEVVSTQEVYNAFSSGKAEVTAIRNFVKYIYDRKPGKLKYLLLFGDATFDYKNNLQNQIQSVRGNWVPVYESIESLNPVYTYSSDDFYGFMGDEAGSWSESESGDHLMDIAVGRLPVKSAAEAQITVDKLIRYASSPKAKGGWRNKIHFVADDGDGAIHQRDADLLAKRTDKAFLSSRIFLDAYPQTLSPLGQVVPQVNEAIRKSINDGVLILNYTGHGGTSGWAEEQVLTVADMLAARGLDNMPVLLTATCDFGRYDDPGIVSGAELMVLSPKGGAIGAITTTRPVYSSTNFKINSAFYDALLKSGKHGAFGDVFRETKNNSLAGVLNRNFTFLGDPSMKLATPEYQVRFSAKPDTLKALQKVLLQLEVVDKYSGDIQTDFNGTARLTVYDKPTVFKTLGNQDAPQEYSELRSKLFEGDVTVKEGKMVCEFVMPKNMDYRLGLARVSVYVVTADSLSDAGAQLDVISGGSGVMMVDQIPPKIAAWLNEVSFRSGDVVGASPELFVKLSDESGINVSKAGIGHNITMIVNDTMTIDLNDYYIADLDRFDSGSIKYPFHDLPKGNYSVKIKVWDIYTNSSEIAFGFQVESSKGIKMENLKVFPNPFDKELSFELSHNRPDEDIEITFRLMLDSGKELGVHRWQYYFSEPVIQESVTSTRLGALMNKMISYIYTVEIRSLRDNSTDIRSGRIIRSP